PPPSRPSSSTERAYAPKTTPRRKSSWAWSPRFQTATALTLRAPASFAEGGRVEFAMTDVRAHDQGSFALRLDFPAMRADLRTPPGRTNSARRLHVRGWRRARRDRPARLNASPSLMLD